MLQQSLDYSQYRDKLASQIQAVPYSRELRLMLANIDAMVTELSKAEVVARRQHRGISELPELKRVNSAIEELEKWLIMGALIN